MSKKIYLSGNKRFMLVDDEDFDELNQYRWYLVKVSKGYDRAYAIRADYGYKTQKTIYAHRQIMKADTNQVVDHIDHDTLNNTRGNLRLCSPSENQHNRLGCHHRLSKFKGVCYRSWTKNPWTAQICINRKVLNLGCYPTEVEAGIVYQNKAKELFGEFNYKVKSSKE